MAKQQTKQIRSKNQSLSANKDSKSQTNWPDVFCRLIDSFHDLAQTGNLIGLFAVGFLVWFISLGLRLPSESIPGIYEKFFSILFTEKFYIIPLSLLSIFSITINIIQHNIYTAHIKDLTEHRSNLVHGLESGELKVLKNHFSSGFDIQEN